MAHLIDISESQFFGGANTTAATMQSFQRFRDKMLNHSDAEASNVGPMNLTDKNVLPSIRKRLAGRIRLLERHNLGELKIDSMTGVQFEGRENIENYLNGVLEYSRELDRYNSNLRISHYLWGFLAASGILSLQNTILDPSNPNWKVQMATVIPLFVLSYADYFKYRLIGNDHLNRGRLKQLRKRLEAKPQKTDWTYLSSEMKIPEEMLKDSQAMNYVDPGHMYKFDEIQSMGLARQINYRSLIKDQFKPTWMGIDLVLTPNEAGDDWLLSAVVRSNHERPKVKKEDDSKGGGLTELVPAKVHVTVPRDGR